METLENRTHEGAGVMSRLCHNLGDAVRNVFRAGHGTVPSIVDNPAIDTSVQSFFHANGITCKDSLVKETSLYHITVKSPEGRTTQVYLSDDVEKELKRDSAQATFSRKVFAPLEACLRKYQGLHLIQAEFMLGQVGECWVLTECPSAHSMKFAEGGILEEDVLRESLRKCSGKAMYKTKRAA